MKHGFILTCLLAGIAGTSQAQDLKKVYLVKGDKVVATYQASDVDYITFALTKKLMLPITPKQGDNTTLVMYNSSDDWDKDPADRKFDTPAGQLVKFMWWADYGYVGNLKITTQSGEDVEYEYVTDDDEFGTCWECLMPEDPIVIETSATEKTDYVGKAFVGSYRGYQIKTGENGVVEESIAPFSLKLNYNTSFYAGNSGEKTFGGCYSFDESANTFSYLDEYSADVYGKKTYGVSGKWFDNGDALVVVNDLNDDKPDNNKYYLVSRSNFTYAAAASDTYGSRYILEMKRTQGSAWYYYDRLSNTIQPVTLNFSKGSSVADASEAVVYDANGEPVLRYERQTATSRPVFTMKGSEAGTYTAQAGSGDNLVLDGFGSASLGSKKGTYTVADGVVSFTDTAGNSYTFVLDAASHTYTSSAASVWDGAQNFAAMVTGRFDDNSASSGMIAVSLNSDFSGNYEEGTVKVTATLTDNYYDTREIVANTASYTYDAARRQITISGLLVGTANGRSTERINITFDVSDDKTVLTCNEDKVLRAVSGGDTRYISLKGLALTAR